MAVEPEDDVPLHAAINAKLAEIAAESPSPPSWYEDWSHLGSHATDEERLNVYKLVRDGGSVPSEAGFFLVAWVVDIMMAGPWKSSVKPRNNWKPFGRSTTWKKTRPRMRRKHRVFVAHRGPKPVLVFDRDGKLLRSWDRGGYSGLNRLRSPGCLLRTELRLPSLCATQARIRKKIRSTPTLPSFYLGIRTPGPSPTMRSLERCSRTATTGTTY